MTELRQDFLTGDWVTIAPDRDKRPLTFKAATSTSERSDINCPFCPENKHITPKETYSKGRIRVVPNLYPALQPESEKGFGYHEVLIDTPNHMEKLHEFSAENICEIIGALQQRIEFFSSDEKIKHIQVFKNNGVKAGASIFHPHWQIVAMPFVAQKHLTMLNNFTSYKQKNGSCFLCDEVKTVIDEKENLICENEDFVAYAPHASLFSYGVTIAPKKHFSDICQLDVKHMYNLSIILKSVLTAYNKVFKNGLDYNICLQNTPLLCNNSEYWHFFLHIIPRLGSLAGFELSTGCYINSVEPKKAASVLRDALK